MKTKKKKTVLKQSATHNRRELDFNMIAKFMVSNKNRNSATRHDIQKLFKCSPTLATRAMNRYVNEGKLTRDAVNINLYWLVF